MTGRQAMPLTWGGPKWLASGCGFFVCRERPAGADDPPNKEEDSHAMTNKNDTGNTKGGLSRRAFLKTSAGTAALIAALQTQFPGGAFAQAAGPEVKGAKL